jgi:DNA-binding CsgD family transcriptional regulator
MRREAEAEVATLIVEGLADREIAERLSLSPHTVTAVSSSKQTKER